MILMDRRKFSNTQSYVHLKNSEAIKGGNGLEKNLNMNIFLTICELSIKL